MPPATNPDLARFMRTYEASSDVTKARIAAFVAICHAFETPSLDSDQRRDVIMAALKFCEITLITAALGDIATSTKDLAVGDAQDRANAYTLAMMQMHDRMIDQYKPLTDRFFNLWEMIDPELAKARRSDQSPE